MKSDKQFYATVCEYAKTAETITVPAVQKRFGVDYITARRAVEEMLDDKYVEFCGGIEYRFIDPAKAPHIIEIKRKIAEIRSDLDPLFEKAVRHCAAVGRVTLSDIQSAGTHDVLFIQANKIAEQMQQTGVCSERKDNNIRQIFVTPAQVDYIFVIDAEDNAEPQPEPEQVFEDAKKEFEKTVNVQTPETPVPPHSARLRDLIKRQSEQTAPIKPSVEQTDDEDDEDDDEDYLSLLIGGKNVQDGEIENVTTAERPQANESDGQAVRQSEDERSDLERLIEPPLWRSPDVALALRIQIERIIKSDSGMDLYDVTETADRLEAWAKEKDDVDAMKFMSSLTFKLRTMSFAEFYALRGKMHGFNTSGGYKFDVVFVIDASDGGRLIERLGGSIGKFDRKLNKAIEEAGCHFDDLRVRTVYFGDYAEDEKAVGGRGFYTMPRDSKLLEGAFNGKQEMRRGSGAALNALEALYVAMKSDFAPVKYTEKGRQIIVLLTDSYPLNLGERKGCVGYSDEFPSNVRELEQIWEAPCADGTGGLSPRYARLIMFVPNGDDGNGHSWSDVAGWYRTSVTYTDEQNRPGEEIDIDTIVAEILRS